MYSTTGSEDMDGEMKPLIVTVLGNSEGEICRGG